MEFDLTNNLWWSCSSSMILISAVAVTGTILFLIRSSSKRGWGWDCGSGSGSGKLPRGPPGWPVVGNLFQFARSGKQFYEYVDDLLPLYGPMFTLKMGYRTLVIVSSGELAHQALIKQGPVFATRPNENPTRSIFSSNKFSVNAAPYGPVWRSLRRNMVQNMVSSSRFREFKALRVAAMDKYMERLRAEARDNDGAVWVLKNARFAVFCILLSMCFGVEMDDEETIERVDQMMKEVLITLNPRLDDYLPILSPFFSKQRKKALEVRNKQIETLLPLIEKRRRSIKSSSIGGSFYLDTLFDITVEGRDSTVPPSDPEIVTLCSEFLNGGTDTTATAVEWAVARLIENPSIQTRLYDEVRSVVGNNNNNIQVNVDVDEDHLDRMPYLQAFTKELLRKHPPTYFALSHAVTQPTHLGGYDIPPGVSVEFYLPGIAHDSNLWNDPDTFDPDRFGPGREQADVTGVKGVKMMPFGAGRRICAGWEMATVHLHLMIARMVQEFEWLPAYPHADLDFQGKLEFTVVMKNPLRAKIKPRRQY